MHLNSIARIKVCIKSNSILLSVLCSYGAVDCTAKSFANIVTCRTGCMCDSILLQSHMPPDQFSSLAVQPVALYDASAMISTNISSFHCVHRSMQ
jgi:hypothetical protein